MVKAATLRAQWLGQQLREMRESAGLTLKDVGDYINRNASTVSRLESGVVAARVPEVLAYLDICGVDDGRRRADLTTMAKDVWQKGWWDGFAADVVGSLIDWIWLESRATEIYSFDVAVLPGLLQTRAYAEAIIRAVDIDATEEQINRYVEIRLARQRRLYGDESVKLSAIIDEGALRRTVGGPTVMRAQLEHLSTMAVRSHIELLVLPSAAGEHPSPEGSFNLFQMRPPYPLAGCIWTPAGNIVIEGGMAESLLRTYDRLRGLALPAQTGLALVSELIDQLE
ncbi:helix-turn-helix domain-containing protein [Micromonospora fiedleri]|uniref:Helix-turn-helix domain-containing protein n=1 Tax=Micromonospora fiedleri TaxID=1157498 RepID=A0ABS1UNN8_9ACTN|nr:helix-turn-helix transcriptional regulator [Micromonospora fiedleri]MBL6276921.1 helix-turn-helix domain-containing protein [Micromonospora fiedleri]WSK43368.1 helix-turn-helix domain-containing protein [Micromonospora maris]